MGKVGEPLVREAVLEGLFYPHRSHDLREAVSNLLVRSEEPAGRAKGIICPHASFQYAGLHEATAFKAAAARDVHLVVILASATHHSDRTPAVPESHVFRTPLGDSNIDRRFISALERRVRMIRRDDLPFLESPAVETPLPFIQYLWPEARIAPCIVPRLESESIDELGHGLVEAARHHADDNVLWVASTNIARGGNAGQTRAVADLVLGQLANPSTNPDCKDQRNVHSPGAYPADTVCRLLRRCTGSEISCEILTRGSSCDFDGNTESNTEYASISLTECRPAGRD